MHAVRPTFHPLQPSLDLPLESPLQVEGVGRSRLSAQALERGTAVQRIAKTVRLLGMYGERHTGPKTIAVHKHKNPGTSSGRLVLLSLTVPTATCEEKMKESADIMRTIDQRETWDKVEGVRVSSIWRTRRYSTTRREPVAKAASE